MKIKDLEKFEVRNFRRMSGTSAECPELPKIVRNFRIKSGTSEETSETSEDFQKIRLKLRYEQIFD